MFETDRHLIVGDVTLPPEGYQSRFSDSLNRADFAFIPVVNVEITSLADGEVDAACRSSSSARTTSGSPSRSTRVVAPAVPQAAAARAGSRGRRSRGR